LCGGWRRFSEAQGWEVRGLARELAAARPDLEALERKRVDLGHRLSDALHARIEAKASRVASIEAHLKHLNPDLVLERGYSIVMNVAGSVVYDVAQIAPGEEVTISLARGSAQAEVKNTRS
jgi:exodeoxyribonuclease VII large subunit